MVYKDFRTVSGILIRRTDNREVHARIHKSDFGINFGANFEISCYGFLDDSTIVVNEFNYIGTGGKATMMVCYDIYTRLPTDSLVDAELEAWMSPTSFIAYRRDGDIGRTFFEYTPSTGVERPLFRGIHTDRCFSVPHSPYFVRTLPGAPPRVYRKSDLSLVQTLNYSGEDYMTPYAFTGDGVHVYAQVVDNTIGKINLLDGTTTERMSLAKPLNDRNRFFLSPDAGKLVVVDPQTLYLIDLATKVRTEITPIYPNGFNSAT